VVKNRPGRRYVERGRARAAGPQKAADAPEKAMGVDKDC